MSGLNQKNRLSSALKSQLMSVATCLPVGMWHALGGRPLILPYYHLVTDEAAPHVSPLYSFKNVAQFKQDVEFFLKNFQPITLDDLLKHLHEGKPLPSRAILLSFDDGFREMAEIVAPILKAKGVSAMFFLNSAFVDNRELCFFQKMALLVSKLMEKPSTVLEDKLKLLLREQGVAGDDAVSMLKSVRYAQRAVLDDAAVVCDVSFDGFLKQQKPYVTSDQIRGLLRDGFSVGGHSLDHPFYGDLTLEEQLRQTQGSVKFLQDNFGVKQRAFAFPHSDRGVAQKFFERSFGEGTLEISFGTSGLLRDSWHGHFQRFSMEKINHSPQQTLARQLIRRCFRGVIQRFPQTETAEAVFRVEKVLPVA